ncbi:MAG: FecR family protein [Ferruginibacter sp.]
MIDLESDFNVDEAIEIAGIFKKLTEDGEVTPAQSAKLQSWIKANPKNKLAFEQLCTRDHLLESLKRLLNTNSNKEIEYVVSALGLEGDEKPLPIPKLIRRINFWVAAAVIIAVLIAGIFFWGGGFFQKSSQKNISLNSIGPGGKAAFLTLAGGKTINLTKRNIQELYPKGVINNAEAGMLNYQKISDSIQPTQNTLTVPNGGEYQILLSDGTKVYLNADSRLVFPDKFNDNERTVSLEGEGYFEVAHNGKPFIVKVKNMQIRVLGTRFNVKAYNDENSIKTTLLQGSVKVSSSKETQILTPGNQAIFTNDNFYLRPVNVEQAIAWKNGLFYFDKTDITIIMKELSRWYNISVNYEGKIPENLFVGELKRNLTLNEALNILEKGGITMKISGNQITIVGKE